MSKIFDDRGKLARLRERARAVVKAWEEWQPDYIDGGNFELVEMAFNALIGELGSQESEKKCVGENPEAGEGRQ